MRSNSAQKAISAVKKRHWAAVGSCKRRPIQGSHLVRPYLFVHSYYVPTPSLPSKNLYLRYYDYRGAAEIEQFHNDKQVLDLAVRRKHRLYGQFNYILLTGLAHNLLAHFHFQTLLQTLCHSKALVLSVFSVTC